MEPLLKLLKEKNIPFNVKQKLFENIKHELCRPGTIEDHQIDELFNELNQELSKASTFRCTGIGIVLEMLTLMFERKLNCKRRTEIAGAILNCLKANNNVNVPSYLKVLHLYSDSDLVPVAESHSGKIFNLLEEFSKLNEEQEAAQVLLLQLVKRICVALSEKGKEAFCKEGIPIWYSSVVPFLYAKPKGLRYAALEVVELIIPMLNVDLYSNNPDFQRFITCIQEKSRYPAEIVNMVKNNDLYWEKIWICSITLLGNNINHSSKTINALLWVVETAFKVDVHKYKAYVCWKVLIDMTDQSLYTDNKMRLINLPFTQIHGKSVDVISIKQSVWLHLLRRIGPKLEEHAVIVLLPFFEFCFGVRPGHTARCNFTQPIYTFPDLHADLVDQFVRMFGHTYCDNCPKEMPIINQAIFKIHGDEILYSVKQCIIIIAKMLNDNKNDVVKYAKCLCSSVLKFGNHITRKLLCIIEDVMKEHLKDLGMFELFIVVFIPSFLDNHGEELANDGTVNNVRSTYNSLRTLLLASKINDTAKLKELLHPTGDLKIFLEYLIEGDDVTDFIGQLSPNALGEGLYCALTNFSLKRDFSGSNILSMWPIGKMHPEAWIKETSEAWLKLYSGKKISVVQNNIVITALVDSVPSNISIHLLPTALMMRLNTKPESAISNCDISILGKTLQELSQNKSLSITSDIGKYILAYVRRSVGMKIFNYHPKPTLLVILEYVKIAATFQERELDEILVIVLNNVYTSAIPNFDMVFDIIKVCTINTSPYLQKKAITKAEILFKDRKISPTEKDKLRQIIGHKLTARLPKLNKKDETKNEEVIMVVPPKWKFNPEKLTNQQKEKFERRRDDIPALYQDMSQSQDNSLRSWQPTGYKADSQSKSSVINDSAAQDAEKILKEIPNAEVCPNIINNLLVAISPGTVKKNPENIIVNKKAKRSLNANIENTSEPEKKKKVIDIISDIIVSLEPADKPPNAIETINNFTDETTIIQSPKVDKSTVNSGQNQQPPSKDVKFSKADKTPVNSEKNKQSPSNDVTDKTAVIISKDFTDKTTVILPSKDVTDKTTELPPKECTHQATVIPPVSAEKERPTRTKKKPKKFDLDDHTITKNRKSSDPTPVNLKENSDDNIKKGSTDNPQTPVKKRKKITLLERQLAIDTIEGHPLIKSSKSRTRTLLSKTIDDGESKGITKNQKGQPARQIRRKSIDNSEVCQKVPGPVKREKNKVKDENVTVKVVTVLIGEPLAVADIQRENSLLSEDVIESSQDSASSVNIGRGALTTPKSTENAPLKETANITDTIIDKNETVIVSTQCTAAMDTLEIKTQDTTNAAKDEETTNTQDVDTQPLTYEDNTNCDENGQNIDDIQELVKADNIVSSPQKEDVEERKNEFLDSTFDMSPIPPAGDEAEDPLVIPIGPTTTSPDVFTVEKPSEETDRNGSPPRVPYVEIKSSPSITANYKKNQPAQTGRGARMLGLCVPDKVGTLQLTESLAKAKPFTTTPPNRNFKVIYNMVDAMDSDEASIVEPSTNGVADCGVSSDDSSGSDTPQDMLTFSRFLPGADASPSAPILKRKRDQSTDDFSSPVSKKKRVSFHDPPVSITKYIERPQSPLEILSKVKDNCFKSPKPKSKMKKLDSYFADIVPLNVNPVVSEDDTLTSTTPLEKSQSQIFFANAVLNNDEPFFPDLISCCDPISNIADQLTSPLWENSVKEEFRGKVNTIGEFASLTKFEINRLSIKSPKVNVAKSVLSAYFDEWQKRQLLYPDIETEPKEPSNSEVKEGDTPKISEVDALFDNNSLTDIIDLYIKRKEEKSKESRKDVLKSLDFTQIISIIANYCAGDSSNNFVVLMAKALLNKFEDKRK